MRSALVRTAAGRIRRWLLPRSVRSRAALAAGLAAAALFTGAAFWFRHIVYQAQIDAISHRAQEFLTGYSIVFEFDPQSREIVVRGAPPVGLAPPIIDVGPGGEPVYSAMTNDVTKDGAALPGPAPAGRDEIESRHPDHRMQVQVSNPRPGERMKIPPGSYTAIFKDVNLYAPSHLPSDETSYRHRVYAIIEPFTAQAAVRAVDRLLIPGVPSAALLVALMAWFATDRALRPVERMRSQAAEFTAHALDQRLTIPRADVRLARLADTFNDTLDRLAESARRQQRFVADAAHELRTPIGSVRAILEVAAAHPDRADQTAVIRDAAIEARRLHRLADDLLLLARLDTTDSTRFIPVDLAELARDQAADRGRTGDVRVTCQTNGPTILLGSRCQLGRLLSNLLDNAERHAKSVVTVDAALDPSTSEVILTVADDGTGIEPADRERVFHPFTRLDDARTHATGGTGLGLAIAHDICVRHGGTITVSDSALGGAEFVVRLPTHRMCA